MIMLISECYDQGNVIQPKQYDPFFFFESIFVHLRVQNLQYDPVIAQIRLRKVSVDNNIDYDDVSETHL